MTGAVQVGIARDDNDSRIGKGTANLGQQLLGIAVGQFSIKDDGQQLGHDRRD